MDLSGFSPAQLEALSISLFDELAKRQLRVKVLDRLSNDGLKNLGFSILEIFKKRYLEASAEDRRLWDNAYAQVVRQLFPEVVTIARQQGAFILLGEQLLKEFGEIQAAYARTKRKPGEERLARGKIVHAANKNGVSWKKMPAHVIEKYPDWFPELKGKRLTPAERNRFAETLRKMARDAEKQSKPNK